MNAKLTPADRQLDNHIADFTDRLLDEEIRKEIELNHQDQSLFELQETAIRLKRAFGVEQLSADAKQRIKSVLATEWEKNDEPKKSPFWHLLNQPRRSTWKSSVGLKYAFRLSFATIAVFFIIILYGTFSTNQQFLPGAATGIVGPIPIFIFLGFVILIAYWLTRRKR